MPRCLVLVTFPASAQALAPGAARALLEAAGPRYAALPGLRRKYFLAGDGEAGGAYEWESRAAAADYFDAAWRERMRAAYGAEPTLRWFDVPALADGERGAFTLLD